MAHTSPRMGTFFSFVNLKDFIFYTQTLKVKRSSGNVLVPEEIPNIGWRFSPVCQLACLLLTQVHLPHPKRTMRMVLSRMARSKTQLIFLI